MSSKKGKFYILCRVDDEGDPYFQPIEATVMIHRGFHFVVHEVKPDSTLVVNTEKSTPGWRVTEMLTGRSIVEGFTSKEKAKVAAREKIDRAGLEKLASVIYHWLEEDGVSPRFHVPRKDRIE